MIRNICILFLITILSFFLYFDTYANLLLIVTCVNILMGFNVFMNYIISSHYKSWSWIQSIFSKLSIRQLMYYVMIGPIIEEYLYRFTFKHQLEYFIDKTYIIHVLSILFGLSHIANYFFINSMACARARIFLQFINTTCLGYILSINESLLLNIIVHSYYNIMSMTMIAKFCVDKNKVINNDKHKLTPMLSIRKRRQSTPSSFINPTTNLYALSQYDFKIVTNEVYEMHRKMSEIINNRRIKEMVL